MLSDAVLLYVVRSCYPSVFATFVAAVGCCSAVVRSCYPSVFATCVAAVGCCSAVVSVRSCYPSSVFATCVAAVGCCSAVE